ncbi:MAG: phosphoribosyl 1,2-cyclic phosphate phosphodiesterase [Bacteroidia bacterium]|jgi:phosphoribosyl 1,2-cyclic phosphate phosphodiesterase
MGQSITLEFLGTGTSQGVPVLGCNCDVCKSDDQRDNRLRSSVIVSVNDKKIVIDTGPDFRQQMLRSNNVDADAVLFTHEHMDHIAGLDDIRAINFLQRKNMPLFGSEGVEESLRRIYHYAFAENPYPGAPVIEFNRIENQPFEILGIPVIPIAVKHGRMPVFGFRFGDLTYITDAKYIDDEEREKIRGTKTLVLNALRKKEHHAHLNLEQALELVEDLKPERAYFTHVSHLLGTHKEVEKELPPHVKLAYDGLIIEA